ncbi:hypothetical protein HBI56_179340 [Parastagonospora nodorum]|nr:hypothetical protein HBI34_163510 [Parastagonospora nodorum]KAH6498521.1 hypothetical protein HBI56_179340 [Parastagonospora nodorum]
MTSSESSSIARHVASDCERGAVVGVSNAYCHIETGAPPIASADCVMIMRVKCGERADGGLELLIG